MKSFSARDRGGSLSIRNSFRFPCSMNSERIMYWSNSDRCIIVVSYYGDHMNNIKLPHEQNEYNIHNDKFTHL